MAILEKEIQKQVINYLTILENQGLLFFTRLNTVGVFDGKNYRTLSNGTKRGIPDILFFTNKFTIWFEIKSQAGKLSEFQKQFQLSVESHSGGFFYEIKDFTKAKEIIDSFVFTGIPYKSGINFG